MEQLQSLEKGTRAGMDKAFDFLQRSLVKIRAGKAHPNMVDGISVDYYGTMTPVNQVAKVSIADARTLTVQPWEKNMLQPIEQAIMNANIGVTPQNDGETIRLPVPSLTEDRRKELVKKARVEGENAKIALRTVRQDSNNQLKQLLKDGLPEDAVKNAEKKVQDITNDFGAKVDELLKAKEKEIMTV